MRRLLYLVSSVYLSDSPIEKFTANTGVFVGDVAFNTGDRQEILDDYLRVDYYKMVINEVMKGKLEFEVRLRKTDRLCCCEGELC